MPTCPLKENFECKHPEILCKEAPCFCPLLYAGNELDLLRSDYRCKKEVAA